MCGELSEYLPLNATNSVISNIWQIGDNADIEGMIEFLEGVSDFSQEIVNELHILFSVLNLEREFYPIGDLIYSIKVKESNFMASTTTFTESEYFMYLRTASVLRFSAACWDAVIEYTNHPYYSHVAEMLDNSPLLTDNSDKIRWDWQNFGKV